jgi:cytochrome P450
MSAEEYETHFPPLIAPEEVFPTARHLLRTCPVTHSEIDGGFWVINRYEDNLRVLQDWRNFAVGSPDGTSSIRVPYDPPGVNRPLFPPIDVNPPLHRQFREIINPYLSPQALAGHRAGFRRIIIDQIETFDRDGHCDLAGQLGKVFPARLTFEELFGIDDSDELTQVRKWIRSLTYDLYREEPAVLGGFQRRLNDWTLDLIAQRRKKTTVENLIDALVHGTVEGRPVTDAELVGTIQILILGGFSTTADATGNLIINMIEHRLEQELRDDHSLIPLFVEEVLRLDPPITARARRCTHDVELGGETLRAGDRLIVNFVAANRDEAEFDHPDEFELHRTRNRHLTFSGGVHRCVGSTMARMSLSIMMEELLRRIGDIQFAPGQREKRVSFSVGVWRAVDYLPITFTPLPR